MKIDGLAARLNISDEALAKTHLGLADQRRHRSPFQGLLFRHRRCLTRNLWARISLRGWQLAVTLVWDALGALKHEVWDITVHWSVRGITFSTGA